MKRLIALPFWFVFVTATAQISKVSIQASGLTCSMCSNSINKAIRSLDYVQDVDANIKNSTFDITFNNADKVNFDQLKKKVEDAGFFVAKFEIEMNFNDLQISNDAHVEANGMLLHFLNVPNRTLSGNAKIRLLDKGFVSAKEYKKNGVFTKMQCYKTGLTSSCCNQKNKSSGLRIYHATL